MAFSPRSSAKAALLLLALLPACSGGKDKDKDVVDPTPTVEDEDNTFAEDGTDANSADTDAQLAASSLISASPGAIGLASLEDTSIGTRDVGDGVKALYLPRKCVNAQSTGLNEATYTFDGCLGPNGLLGVSGTIVAHFTADATKLHLDLTYTDFKVNDAEITKGVAVVDVVADGAKRTMTWGADLEGTTAHDKDFRYHSATTLAWTLGDACFALDGETEGQVRKRDIKTEVKNFRRCRRGCPEAGGQIVVTNVAKNKVVTIDFDGTRTAKYTNPNGKELDLLLVCKE